MNPGIKLGPKPGPRFGPAAFATGYRRQRRLRLAAALAVTALVAGGCSGEFTIGTSARTDSEILDAVSLSEQDAADPGDFSLMDGGDQVVNEVTLDLCDADYPSEALRVARRQVQISGQPGWVSSEAVIYDSPDAAEQALYELEQAVAECDGEGGQSGNAQGAQQAGQTAPATRPVAKTPRPETSNEDPTAGPTAEPTDEATTDPSDASTSVPTEDPTGDPGGDDDDLIPEPTDEPSPDGTLLFPEDPGQPSLTWKFGDAPDADWPQVAGVSRQAYSFEVSDGNDALSYVSTYLRRGRVLLAVYVSPPGSQAELIRNSPTEAKLINVMSNRLAALPAADVS